MKAYYDRRAPEYDDWWLGRGRYADQVRPGWEDDLHALELFIAGLRPVRTLDVACGTGFLTRHLRGDVVALDASARMLELAAEQAPNARRVQGDALDLPFPDHSFDRVFTSYFYCHLEPPQRERFVEEARRVAPELVVVGSVRHEGDPASAFVERRLQDGSTWTVFKRVFDGSDLAGELGGEIVFTSAWFLVVRA